MTRVLLTGAGGFIASHVAEHLLTVTDWDVAGIDSFRHKGKTDRLSHLVTEHPDWRERLTVITHDLRAPFSDQMAAGIGAVDYVIAMASESHVPRSIEDPVTFTTNNHLLALSTLEYCRQAGPRAVIWISTDEVYGPRAQDAPVRAEWSAIMPSSPYAASKAAQEALAFAYWRTYQMPLTIVNFSNIFGERQDGEKFLPLLVRGVLTGDMLKIHAGLRGEVGSRYYLHAANLAGALHYMMTSLPPALYFQDHPGNPDRPDRYNVTSPDGVSNLDLARQVAGIIGLPLHYKLVPFDRPGHDAHYGLDGAKLAAAGWKPPLSFGESLERTVRWYLRNREWLKP
jgi:dTDP-glucose 4,6-dehydratase